MPRRKASDPVSGITRSRTGCNTCRRRRIRCDNTPGTCFNCGRKGLPCDRHLELKWQMEYEQLGLTFGREGVWRKRPQAPGDSPIHVTLWTLPLPRISGCHFVNVTPDVEEGSTSRQGEYQALSPHCRTHVTPNLPSTLPIEASFTLRPTPPFWPRLTHQWQWRLVDYYVERICPLTVASGGRDSPLAVLLLPFASSASLDVQNAMMALSAMHMARNDTTQRQTAFRLEGSVLASLRHKVQATQTVAIGSDPEMPVIMLLLCLSAIIDGCDRRWVAHLKGARDLVALRRQDLSAVHPVGPVLAFTDSFFAFQDVIGRTACGERPVFDSTYWDANDTLVDGWLGCSPALVSIIGGMTELSRQRQMLSAAEFESRSSALEAALEQMQQHHPPESDPALRTVAELKQMAAHVMLNAALRDANPSSDFIRQRVVHLLATLAAFNGHCRAGCLWPLFVAATELDPEQDEVWVDEASRCAVHGRRFVLQQLEVIASRSLADVSMARGVIIQVWEARDQVLLNGCAGVATAVNDWNHFVAPICTNISLV